MRAVDVGVNALVAVKVAWHVVGRQVDQWGEGGKKRRLMKHSLSCVSRELHVLVCVHVPTSTLPVTVKSTL